MKDLIICIVIILTIVSCSKSKVVIIDEQIQNVDVLSKLDTADIFKYEVWSPGTAPLKYSKYKTDGLIIVKTKVFESKLQQIRFDTLNKVLDFAEKGANVLIMFNGVEVHIDKFHRLRTLMPKELKSVEAYDKKSIKIVLEENTKDLNLIINTYDLKVNLIE